MKNQISLNIKTPCMEHFDQFSPTPKGGFCGSCQKEVIDFTKMNAEDIQNYFNHSKTHYTCGRFNSKQLEINKQPKKKISFWSGVGLACLSLFSLQTAHSQEVKTDTESGDRNASEIENSQFKNDILVKGKVSEETIPLPGVNVILEGTTIGTQTNFDGDFEFPEKLKKGDVLIFSYIGMTTQKVVITNEHSASNIALEVDMKSCDMIIMGKIAVKQVYKSKRD